MVKRANANVKYGLQSGYAGTKTAKTSRKNSIGFAPYTNSTKKELFQTPTQT